MGCAVSGSSFFFDLVGRARTVSAGQVWVQLCSSRSPNYFCARSSGISGMVSSIGRVRDYGCPMET